MQKDLFDIFNYLFMELLEMFNFVCITFFTLACRFRVWFCPGNTTYLANKKVKTLAYIYNCFGCWSVNAKVNVTSSQGNVASQSMDLPFATIN